MPRQTLVLKYTPHNFRCGVINKKTIENSDHPRIID